MIMRWLWITHFRARPKRMTRTGHSNAMHLRIKLGVLIVMNTQHAL